MNRHVILWLSFLTLSFNLYGQENLSLDKIAAVVGDGIVLGSEVEAQYYQMMSEGLIEANKECEVLDKLMLEKLFVSQAEIDSITVSPEEVESELDRRLRYFVSMFGTKEKLEEYYGKTILELKDDFREDIRKQLVADRMRQSIYGGMTVSPKEVKAFYADIPKDSLPFFDAEYEIGQLIMYPKVSQEQKDYTREKLEKIRQEIEEGEDFGFMALVNSEDPGSASEEGSLGFISRGELVKEFEAAAFSLEPGEVSDIVESQFGFHLIKMIEKKGERIKVSHILLIPKVTSFDKVAVSRRMDSILHQLKVDSLSWKQAVAEFSEDEESKMNGGLISNPNTGTTKFELAQLEQVDKNLVFSLDDMEVDDYSEVLAYRSQRAKDGYRIIWLKTETEPHVADLHRDYSKIKAAAKQQKQQKTLDNWVKQKRNETYVKIDEEFRDCVSLAKWLEKTQ